MTSMQSWDERQLELLRPQYPEWDIWTVRSIYPRPLTTWCARPKGHPVATVNTDSPEHLIEEIGRQSGTSLAGRD
jgi:hypothetical protein